MVGKGGTRNTANYTPRISEDQMSTHTGFNIPGNLFVHNIKKHLEFTTGMYTYNIHIRYTD